MGTHMSSSQYSNHNTSEMRVARHPGGDSRYVNDYRGDEGLVYVYDRGESSRPRGSDTYYCEEYWEVRIVVLSVEERCRLLCQQLTKVTDNLNTLHQLQTGCYRITIMSVLPFAPL